MAELDVQLRLKGLDLFSPGKQTLIVARFAAPARLIALQAAVEASADGRGINHSGSQRRLAGSGWVAHCMLGKPRASKIEVANIGARASKTLQKSSLASLQAVRLAVVGGLVLCGETPMQAYLDWKFRFPVAFQAKLNSSTPPVELNVKPTSTLPEVPLSVYLHIGILGDRVIFVVFSILGPHSLAALEIVGKRMAARVRQVCRGERCRGSSTGGEREA